MPDPATSTDTFALVYEGDSLNSGEMDVFDLAPALLAVGETFKAAGEALNGSGAIVTTSVHADFRKGSFEITLSVHQHLRDAAATLFAHASGVWCRSTCSNCHR